MRFPRLRAGLLRVQLLRLMLNIALHLVRVLVAILRLLRERAPDHRVESLRHTAAFGRHVEVAKRQVAGQHFVEHDPE